MKCSYCQTEMQIATVQKKRPVPSGAQDLGLTDAVVCWQCSRCGLTSEGGIRRCRCGAIIEPEQVPNRATKLELVNWPGSYDQDGCTQCTLCSYCNKPVGLAEYSYSVASKKEFKSYDDYCETVNVSCRVYYHIECLNQKKSAMRENGVALRKYDPDDYARKANWLQDIDKEEDTAYRRTVGLCVNCGKLLVHCGVNKRVLSLVIDLVLSYLHILVGGRYAWPQA